jgi:hypothetical protein
MWRQHMQRHTLCLLDLPVTSDCDSCSGFEFVRVNIMVGPNEKKHMNDKEVLREVL